MRKSFRQEISHVLEIPLDVSLNLPKVTVLGNLGVLIENHRGLVHYSEGSIVIGVGAGQISVFGDFLEIEEVDKEDILVRGTLKRLEMDIPGRYRD